jgi:hypothetical protein
LASWAETGPKSADPENRISTLSIVFHSISCGKLTFLENDSKFGKLPAFYFCESDLFFCGPTLDLPALFLDGVRHVLFKVNAIDPGEEDSFCLLFVSYCFYQLIQLVEREAFF